MSGAKQFYEGMVTPVTNGNGNNSLPGSRKKYTNVSNQYTEAQKFSADCAELTIMNQGASTLFINGVAFAPGTGIAFSCNSDEEDITIYSIFFTGAGLNLCTIWRKVYA